MSGFDKVVGSYEEAMAGLEDNMTVIAGGFGLCGIPENLIKEIRRKGTRGLTVVSNNCWYRQVRPRHPAGRQADPQDGRVLCGRERPVRGADDER